MARRGRPGAKRGKERITSELKNLSNRTYTNCKCATCNGNKKFTKQSGSIITVYDCKDCLEITTK